MRKEITRRAAVPREDSPVIGGGRWGRDGHSLPTGGGGGSRGPLRASRRTERRAVGQPDRTVRSVASSSSAEGRGYGRTT